VDAFRDRERERERELEERGEPSDVDEPAEDAPPPPPPAPARQTTRSTVTGSGGGSPYRLIASYNAFIGNDDLYNSRGSRLSAPWQVLRQDRANVHRFGVSQSGDEGDPIFSSTKNRAIMERLVANGTIQAGAGQRIVNGNVSVRVEIYGSGSSPRRVNVTVR